MSDSELSDSSASSAASRHRGHSSGFVGRNIDFVSLVAAKFPEQSKDVSFLGPVQSVETPPKYLQIEKLLCASGSSSRSRSTPAVQQNGEPDSPTAISAGISLPCTSDNTALAGTDVVVQLDMCGGIPREGAANDVSKGADLVGAVDRGGSPQNETIPPVCLTPEQLDEDVFGEADFIRIDGGLKELAGSPFDPDPVWIRGSSSLPSGALRWTTIGLHNEVLLFANHMSLSRQERMLRHWAFCRLRSVASRVLPGARLYTFGSEATDLCLPFSDVDVCIFGIADVQSAKAAVVQRLRALGKELDRQDVCRQLQVIDSARVPIVKYRDKQTGILIDVSLATNNGLKNNAYMRKYLKTYPALRPLMIVLKHFLRMRGLHETYSGGIGSYALFLMVVSHLQLHSTNCKHRISASAVDLGTLLADFFALYGAQLQCMSVAINPGARRYQPKQQSLDLIVNSEHTDLSRLCILDPNELGNDVGGKSYEIEKVRTAFRHAWDVLTSPLLLQACRSKAPAKDGNRADVGVRHLPEEADSTALVVAEEKQPHEQENHQFDTDFRHLYSSPTQLSRILRISPREQQQRKLLVETVFSKLIPDEATFGKSMKKELHAMRAAERQELLQLRQLQKLNDTRRKQQGVHIVFDDGEGEGEDDTDEDGDHDEQIDSDDGGHIVANRASRVSALKEISSGKEGLLSQSRDSSGARKRPREEKSGEGSEVSPVPVALAKKACGGDIDGQSLHAERELVFAGTKPSPALLRGLDADVQREIAIFGSDSESDTSDEVRFIEIRKGTPRSGVRGRTSL